MSYTKSFSNNNVTAMLGTHAEEYTHTSLTGWGKNLIREEYAFTHPSIANNDTLVTPKEVLGGFRDDAVRAASIFGRLSYNYAERYMINLTVRSDKSSKLSPNENYQTGIFPSASVGWVVSREDFWQFEPINFMKLRYSYGTNGSLGAISPFDYVPLIGFTGNVYADAADNVLQGATPVKVANEALSWETTEMHNAGVDLRFFDSKLSATVEYFYKKTRDLLTEAPIPGYVGNNPPEANAGIVVNKGLELELSYRSREGAFQYEVGGNVSFLDNQVTVYPGGDNGANLGTGGVITRIDEGYPIYYFYGYETDGLWNDQAELDANNFYADTSGALVEYQGGAIPGDIRIVNQNGDSTINSDDRTYIGSPYPDIMAGFYFSAYYKNFDFRMNITASIGNEVYFGAYRNDLPMPNRPEYFYTEAWSTENQDAEFFRPTISSRWNFQHNDLFVQNGSYLKLRNVELGYTLPKGITDRLQINTLRIHVTVNNAFILSKYKGADPEMGYTAGIQSFGIDRGYYPQARQVLFGVNLSF
jgi:TonB-linked SusC/RagA family outer membrane protein